MVKSKPRRASINKQKIVKVLESMYVNNPAMKADIDSYNYGIHDCIEKIKSLK